MRIFISWSGSQSKRVADYLNNWLLNLPLQGIEPWVSKTGIDPGTRWEKGLSGALEGSDFGVLCLTKDNQAEAWVCFEAGALSKITDKAYVVPYLIGMKPSELEYPLKQFQAVQADKEGTWDLIKLIHKATRDQTRSEETIKGVFEKLWPDLEKVIEDARNEVKTPDSKKPELDEIQTSIEQVREVVESLSSRFSEFLRCSTPVLPVVPRPSSGISGPQGYGSPGSGYGRVPEHMRASYQQVIYGQQPLVASEPTDFSVDLAGDASVISNFVNNVGSYFKLTIHELILSKAGDSSYLSFFLDHPPADIQEVLHRLAQEAGVKILSIIRKAV